MSQQFLVDIINLDIFSFLLFYIVSLACREEGGNYSDSDAESVDSRHTLVGADGLEDHTSTVGSNSDIASLRSFHESEQTSLMTQSVGPELFGYGRQDSTSSGYLTDRRESTAFEQNYQRDRQCSVAPPRQRFIPEPDTGRRVSSPAVYRWVPKLSYQTNS